MLDVEFLIVLLAAVAALSWLAHAVRVPYPVFLVLGGLAIGLLPGLPRVELDPDVVLLIFLPPLLYHAAFFTSPRELREHARQIGSLAVGLVLATMVLVAVSVHELVGQLSWAECFVLGAIVGPTDPVAAISVFRRIGAPDRLTTIVEGEALINDGIALVAFRVAAGAIGAGTFSVLEAGWQFVAAAAGGVAIGLAAGWIVRWLRRYLDDPPIEITVSLFTPYLAFLPADHLGASGVLAAVSAGLFLAYQVPTGLFHASTRLQAMAFWDVFVFLLTALLFVLVGLQVRPVLEALGDRDLSLVAGATVVTVAAVVGARMAWLLVLGGPAHSRGERLVLGWSGPRGAVSLAAALAVPADAPGRELILFLTFAVIVATLVVQGLTLPALVRRFAPEDANPDREATEERARETATRAALERLEELQASGRISDDAAEYARRRYDARLDAETETDALRAVTRELADVERATVERLAEDGEIDQSTARRLERELDLQDERWSEMDRSPVA